jgi:hypothetical protein
MPPSAQMGCHPLIAHAECAAAVGAESSLAKVSSVARVLKSVRRGCAALLVCLIALDGRAASQDPNVDRSPLPDSPTAAAIDQLRLSDALADFGEHNADPLALIEAAKIRKLLPAPLNGSNEAPSDLGWESLLARAAQLAGPDPMVKSLIADVRRLKARDIPVIPLQIKILHKQIRQKGADRAEVRFLAGELAVVYVHPVHGAGLELSVYDDLNNLICSAGGSAEGPECRWRPRRDGSYLIDVRNDSAADVDYELAINRETVKQ